MQCDLSLELLTLVTSLPWWTGTWTLNHEPSKLAPLSGICQGLLSQQRERKVRRCACYWALGVSLYHPSEKDVAEGATCESGSRSSVNTDQAGTWSQISKPHTKLCVEVAKVLVSMLQQLNKWSKESIRNKTRLLPMLRRLPATSKWLLWYTLHNEGRE